MKKEKLTPSNTLVKNHKCLDVITPNNEKLIPQWINAFDFQIPIKCDHKQSIILRYFLRITIFHGEE